MWRDWYEKMPWVEETLMIYLSPGAASSLKAPVLPSNPCQMTSRLVDKAYAVAGQADEALHTMAVLQAHQADLLKYLSPSTPPSGRSMAAMVTTERHLWLNLSRIKEEEKFVLLYVPVLPSGLLLTP